MPYDPESIIRSGKAIFPSDLRSMSNVVPDMAFKVGKMQPENAVRSMTMMPQSVPNINFGQVQNASEIARGQPLLKLFNDLSKVNTPKSDAQMIDVGKKMLADPKYQDQWGSVKDLLSIMQRGAEKVGPAIASQAPRIAAAASIPLHGMAGLIMPRLKDTFSLTNPQGSQMSL